MASYPYHADFAQLAGFNLDMSSNVRLRLTNFLVGLQYRFRRPMAGTRRRRYRDGRLTLDVITPDGPPGARPCVYYSHGGGFAMDLLPAHMDICSEYARRVGCIVVLPHYRVSVTAPFPAALDDCAQGLRWTMANADELGVDPRRVALGGESAGGALTASLSQRVRDEGLMDPIFQMLIYPVTSATLDSASMTEMGDAPVWGAKNAKLGWEKYLAGHPSPPPYASPLETESLSGLPPAYIEPAEFDCLRDEGVAYARRLEEAGIPVDLNVTEGTIHAFDLNKDSAITKAPMQRRVDALTAAFGGRA